MNTYLLTPDAYIVALAVMIAVVMTVALCVRLLDDLRTKRRPDSEATTRNLRNAAEWDKYRGRINPSRLPVEKM